MTEPRKANAFAFDGDPSGRLDVLALRMLDRLAEQHLEGWPRVRRALGALLFEPKEKQPCS